jgi:hypothetical protein
VSTDKLEVIGINDLGTVITPAQNSVDTDKIQDDAVTAAKLANSINTEIAANTAKVTNATHTGDVTGATALTIASGAVDLAMLSATGTASASTFLRGDNSWTAVAGGLSEADTWRLTTTETSGSATITTNLERDDTYGEGLLGTGMTESSGVFTFPSTGYWLVIANGVWNSESENVPYCQLVIEYTANDGGAWNNAAYGLDSIGNHIAGYEYAGGTAFKIFDITDVANDKVRFTYSTDGNNARLDGDGNTTKTGFYFIKLGDT